MNKKENQFWLLIIVGFLIFCILFYRFFTNTRKIFTFFAMDTFFELTTKDRKANSDLKPELEKLIEKIDLNSNSYNPDSEIATINKNAGKYPVKVNKETLSVLMKAVKLSKGSDGLFDITFQPLQDLYGFHNGQYAVPSPEEIAKAKQKVDYRKVLIDETNSTIYVPEGMKINCSGFLKGFVLDQVKQYLNQKGIRYYFLNFGGNLYIQEEEKQKIGIQHPRKESLITSFPLQNGFVSTSADYQQFFEKEGIRYTHIINPITGSCQSKLQTITIIGEDGFETDFLSTTLFLMDPSLIDTWLKTKNRSIQYFGYDGQKEYGNLRK